MKVVIQRVSRASVAIDNSIVASIGSGLVILLGVKQNDTEQDAQYLVSKIVRLRIFSDSAGKFNLSALDTNADMLVVSQFTLLADARKGHRPGFTDAAPPDKARALYEYFLGLLSESGLRVEKGEFQKKMLVEIHNDGPVTIILDSEDCGKKNRG